MAKKYGKLIISTADMYKYIGYIVSYNNLLTITPYLNFDIEIKSIKYIDQYQNLKKISMQPIIDEKLITTSFSEVIIDSCVVYFILYFSSEEEALYFKMKYCS